MYRAWLKPIDISATGATADEALRRCWEKWAEVQPRRDELP